MTARDEVLARVRAAVAGAPGDPGQVPRDYRQSGRCPPGDRALLDRFVERVSDYRATVRRTTPPQLPGAVAAALADGLEPAEAPARPPRVVVPAGLPVDWLAAAEADVTVDAQLSAQELDRCDAVVTAAALAIAETGTIVLDGAPDQGRRALSLVPDVHVCVVHAEQVVADVPDALPRLRPTRPSTWVSGPSATSDIELDRVEGVHGPRTLQVVLVVAIR